jgi:membrane fusion protein (multidrug efflux system)
MNKLYAALLLAVFAFAACGNPVDSAEPEEAAEPEADVEDPIVITPIEAAAPVRGEISSFLETTTRVTAERRVEVTAKSTGRCEEVLVEEGDAVRKGEVLARLDQSDAQAQLRQAQVQLRQTRAEHERARKMLEAGLISEAEYDNARFSYENAQASVEVQQLQIEDLTIHAPISGVVTQRNVQEGVMVTSGMPVFNIIDPSSFVLYINPVERELPGLSKGQKAEVAIDAMREGDFNALVEWIAPTVDPTSGAVDVRLAIPADVREDLREGAFARVRLITVTHENALLVPKDSVVEENAREYVFVVTDEPAEEAALEEEETLTDAAEEDALYARRVEVETGLEDSERVEILSGIDDDDLVVTMGQSNLKSGSRVRITNVEDQIAAFSDLDPEEALTAARQERESAQEDAKARAAVEQQ